MIARWAPLAAATLLLLAAVRSGHPDRHDALVLGSLLAASDLVLRLTWELP